MKRPPVRPRSAGISARHAADAPFAGRDRVQNGGATASGIASGRKPRASSAHSRRDHVDKAVQALQEQCMELKRNANSLTEDNMKSRTRLRVLERELQKRDRLVRSLADANKLGVSINVDLLEKLREERNMLPMVRKKTQELQNEIEEKEQEIRDIKRDPQFTRIIELQVEYATWQHEAKRLDALIQEAAQNSSQEGSRIARQEVEVHERRVEKLRADLATEKERHTQVEGELADMQEDHAGWLSQYQEKEKELQEEQEDTRNLAIAFKAILQERKQVESMQEEIDHMNIARKRYEEELQTAEVQASQMAAQSAAQRASMPFTRSGISENIKTGPAVQSPGHTASLLNALRHVSAARSGEASLFAEFVRRDADCDGLLSMDELAQALSAVGFKSCSQADLAALIDVTAGTGAGPADRLRWLDLLLLLDRSTVALPSRPLPSIKPLRALCLRIELTVDELQGYICGVSTRSEAEALFNNLASQAGMSMSFEVSAWVDAWEAHGSHGLLLRLPISDVAVQKDDFDAWFLRCADAVRLHRKDLVDSFRVWREDMLLDQEQFNMVCSDVLGLQLSPDDISDLALFVSGRTGGSIDGGTLLRFDEHPRR